MLEYHYFCQIPCKYMTCPFQTFEEMKSKHFFFVPKGKNKHIIHKCNASIKHFLEGSFQPKIAGCQTQHGCFPPSSNTLRTNCQIYLSPCTNGTHTLHTNGLSDRISKFFCGTANHHVAQPLGNDIQQLSVSHLQFSKLSLPGSHPDVLPGENSHRRHGSMTM